MPENINTEKVEDTELVGRSLHGRQENEIKSRDGVIKWMQFYDSRLTDDLSMDRLGNPSINNQYLLYLVPRMAKRNPKPFKGWGKLSVSTLHELNLQIYPDEVKDEDPLVENKLHSQISRENHRDKDAAKSLAKLLSARALFLAPPDLDNSPPHE